MSSTTTADSRTRMRIGEKFRDLAKRDARGLVIYLTAGDPNLEATRDLLPALERAGADVIELGIPFSDPLADGPVIQRASERALKAGATLPKILAALPQWRRRTEVPLVLFSYYNPILQYGLKEFAADARRAGADGVLAVDLTPEEAGAYVERMREANLDTIFLASPTSTDERLRKIAEHSTGFLYLVSRMGVTGERKDLSGELPALVNRVKAASRLPLAVGFGISTAVQVRAVQRHAEAAVVGSAVVRYIEQNYSRQGAEGVEEFVHRLKGN